MIRPRGIVPKYLGAVGISPLGLLVLAYFYFCIFFIFLTFIIIFIFIVCDHLFGEC
jgi:hypothetical protein